MRELSGKRGLIPASVAEYRNPLHPAPSALTATLECLFLAMSYQRLGEPDAAREALDWAVHFMERKKPPNGLLPNELRNLRTEAEELLSEG